MSKSYEEISKYNANSNGKTDSNLANDSNHLGGIEASEYATKKYVQDYHDGKESTLKQYIDKQDLKVLEDSKEYTNTMIRNQDFSSFAKLTDVQALDKKLSDKITECGNTCANNLKTEIKKVVNDTNANFIDVNNAITSLNKNQKELFQSVSNGKKKIAEAITDKGVTTSATASYDTMANNIKKIDTGVPEGYVYTGDATATASDISLGKSAYVNGQKIYGTNTNASSTQLTPTYGTDTSGTTATASDILLGKTAYSNGQLLVGTLQNADVQEIYGLTDEEYTITNAIGYSNYIANDDEKVTYKSTGVFGISKDGTFIVNECIVNNNGTETRYIQSRRMNDTEVYTSATAGSETAEIIKRKSLWTFEELGLDSSNAVDYISFGNAGFNNVPTDSALCIIQGNKVHFYRYSVSNLSYGYIGYDYSTDYNWHWVAEIKEGETVLAITCPATCANLNANTFALFAKNGSNGKFFIIKIDSLYKNIVSVNGSLAIKVVNSADKHGLKVCYFSSNDNYIYGTMEDLYMDGIFYSNGCSTICKIEKTSNNYYPKKQLSVPDTCTILPNEVQVMCQGYLYKLSCEDGQTPAISEKSEIQYITRRSRYSGFSPDLAYYYEAYQKLNESKYSSFVNIYKTDFKSTTEWQPVQSIALPSMTGNGDYTKLEFSPDMSFATAGNTEELYRIRKSHDQEKLIGVTYKNQNFYSSSII